MSSFILKAAKKERVVVPSMAVQSGGGVDGGTAIMLTVYWHRSTILPSPMFQTPSQQYQSTVNMICFVLITNSIIANIIITKSNESRINKILFL